MITQTEESFYQKQSNEILKESSLVGKQARRFQIFYMPCTSCSLKPTLTRAMLSPSEAALHRICPLPLSQHGFPKAHLPSHTQGHAARHTGHKLHPVSVPALRHCTSLQQTLEQEQPRTPSEGADSLTAESWQETISNLQHQEKEQRWIKQKQRKKKNSRDFC